MVRTGTVIGMIAAFGIGFLCFVCNEAINVVNANINHLAR